MGKSWKIFLLLLLSIQCLCINGQEYPGSDELEGIEIPLHNVCKIGFGGRPSKIPSKNNRRIVRLFYSDSDGILRFVSNVNNLQYYLCRNEDETIVLSGTLLSIGTYNVLIPNDLKGNIYKIFVVVNDNVFEGQLYL